jgi:hypothetical protein
MQEIMIEILIGVLILGLMSAVVIPLYTEVQMTVNKILYRDIPDEIEKSLFGLDEDMEYMGGEVIAQIGYFSSLDNRTVTVVNSGQSMSYIDSAYDGEEFQINLYDRYSFEKDSSDGVTEYIYTLKNQGR